MSPDLVLPPLSLYIHIPWCVRKCPYCDFNSHTSPVIDEAAYIERLKLDLQAEKAALNSRQDTRKIHSIFFGGGTPSLFSAESIHHILTHVNNIIGFENRAIEITLEANPGTFEQDKFSGFYQAGVNRLSIGIQSFNPQHLETLGRIHSSDEAKQAVSIARHAGFNNINLDLMHGLPQQSIDNAMADIQQAIDLSPEHISWYQLTIEPNTAFYRQPPPLPADEILGDIQYHGGQLLADHDYHHYEISAFSRPQKQAAHNINYWQFGDYLGIGAGAHGKVTDIKNQRIIRTQKTRLPEHYLTLSDTPNSKSIIVERDELALEFMMNALRLHQGAPANYFIERTGLPLTAIETIVGELQQQGLMEQETSVLKTTELGQRFLNTVLQAFSDN